MRQLPRWDAGLPALLLMVAAAFGWVVGIVIAPDAVAVVAGAGLLQILASVPAWRGVRRPIPLVAAVSAVSLVFVAEPTLRALLAAGAAPWLTVATALGTVGLVRRARDRTDLAFGAVLLLVAVVAVAHASARDGVPLVTSVLASSVPVLGGALAVAAGQLRTAREDRLRRWTARTAEAAVPDSRLNAHSALLLVALRAETMLRTARDETTVATARDLRTVALQGLHDGPLPHETRLRVEVAPDHQAPEHETRLRVEVAPDHQAPEFAADSGVANDEGTDTRTGKDERSVPELSDREREILRLLTTGASNAEIGRELYLSEATIKGHVSRLIRRFDCDNRTRLAVTALPWVA